MFTERFNNSGYGGGSTSGFGFFFSIIPFGILLTQYTITGFDASAHLSEETGSAAEGGGQGHLAVDLLLGDRRLHPAAVRRVRDPERRTGPAGQRAGRRRRGADLQRRRSARTGRAVVLFISAVGQFFCTVSCMTSASRMTFAFSRDGAMPGSKRWSALTSNRVPANAVIAGRRSCAADPDPAGADQGRRRTARPVPLAFYAVTSIAVIGLYLAFAIPIWLRSRHGDKFDVGLLEQRRRSTSG